MDNAKYIEVSAAVRYWEDARVDGVTDSGGDIPLRNGENWEPVINLETGFVKDWPLGVTAEVHYKVCDEGEYWLQDAQGQRIAKWKGCYVPNAILCPKGNGYGDYIIFNISASSQIENWRQPGIDAEQWEPIEAERATQPAQDQPAAVRAVPEVALQDFKNGIHRLVMRHIDRMNDVSDNDCAEQIIASFVQGFDGLYEAYMPLRVAEIEAQRATDAEAKLAAIRAQEPVEFPMDERNDDPAEAAFWRFDARHKGYGRWKQAPQSQRDAFKAEYRAALAQRTATPSQSDTSGLRG